MTLLQVAQRSSDLDRSIAFYGDVLGLSFITSFDPPGLAFFDLDGVRLLLEAGAPSAILYLTVDDIDGEFARLRDAGVEMVEEPHLVYRDDDGTFHWRGTEEWMCFFKDPDDNLLALVELRR